MLKLSVMLFRKRSLSALLPERQLHGRSTEYLTGADLDKVSICCTVVRNPRTVSEDPTNDFEAWIWSWGGFPIKATITTKNGQVFEKDLDFSFKTKFEEAQSKGVPQAMRCEE